MFETNEGDGVLKGSLSKDFLEDSEDVIRKCNFAFLGLISRLLQIV